MRPQIRTRHRAATLLASLGLILAAALGGSDLAAASALPGLGADSAASRAAATRIERFWTPQRMREAKPLEYRVGPHGNGRTLAVTPPPLAGASALKPTIVPNPEEPPNAVEGRIFLIQGRFLGFCSGTAIDSPTRQLVLTAGHCVASGPLGRRRRNVLSSFLEFVPAYNDGVAPFGAFVAIRGKVLAPKQWTRFGNPDFDMGAFLTNPNSEGVNVADAVGGGVKIVMDLNRHQQFQAYGYPGETRRMQTCASPYLGDDPITVRFPGPPTQAIRCHWPPGSSGGGWLIENGTQINGINTYLHRTRNSNTFGPYFAQETIGRLVAGL
jgi:hypothetical protein